jgi:2-polyprenyl-6-methoxyphenol hydroxylase-like FAD-dependent oxidoreductase
MLDLHEESGLAAIRECGLYDQFLNFTGECSEANKVSDKDGNILYEDKGELSHRPEISRHNLTKLLASDLPADSIQWGHKLLSASPQSDTKQTVLDFGTHGKHAFNLVIGADGAWSQVRRMLTNVKPQYANTQSFGVTIRHITTKYSHLAELVGDGSFSALGNRHGVMSQRGSQDSARIYVFLTHEDEQFHISSGMAGQPATFAKDRLLKDDALLGQWGPILKELVTVACDEEAADNPDTPVEIRPLYMLPLGTSWEHNPLATVIGDAAHLMCPWAGEGVNVAMWDSLLLSHAIIKAYEVSGQDSTSFQNALSPAMKDFEVEMVARAKGFSEEAVQNGKMLFGEDAAKAFAGFFLSIQQYIENAQR